MKKLIIPAIALICFASCTKPEIEREWKCTITDYTPRGIVPGPQVQIVKFNGTYSAMKAFEASQTYADTVGVYNDAPEGNWRTCHCR